MHLLAAFSLRNRALIALVTVVIAFFGGVALTSLKQELIPSITFPQLVVVTQYPGASPEVVDHDVSTPIETAIEGISGIEDTSATSSSSLSSVSARFQYGTDITEAEQKVQRAIDQISSQLPQDLSPQVVAGSLDDLPVVQVSVTSRASQQELASQLDTIAVPKLRDLDGVRDVSVLGARGQRVQITPDTAAMLAHGLSNQSIRDALSANGSLLPEGQITENGKTLTVQAGSSLTSTDQIAALPLLGGTSPAAIGDVATVAIVQDPVTGISRVNGKPALTVAITKTPDGNTVDVSKAVRAALPGIEKSMGSGAAFTVVFDQAPFIEQSIDSLTSEGLLGLGFAVLIILVFLLSIRSTLVTAISIPVSVLITFIALFASHYTLNILTMGALTISIGRVVDDSIVVIENIKRHLGLGEDKLTAIRTAVREVATAVTAATATTVAVFLPLAFVGDVTGELFRPFALTVTIALVASLFVALTIVPVLAYWFLGTKAHKHAEATASASEDELEHPTRLQRVYLPVIRWTLRRPLTTMLLAAIVLVGTGALLPAMKTNFLGDSGQNTLTVTQTLPPGTSLDVRDADARTVEKALRAVKGVDVVQTSIGSSGSSIQEAFLGSSDTRFSITTDPDADQTALQADVRRAVGRLTDVGDVTLSTSGGGFGSSDIEVDLTATGSKELSEASDAVLRKVRGLSAVAQATSDLSVSQPYIAIVVDRQAAAAAGLSESAVGGIVANSMLPAAIGTVEIDEKSLSIYIDDPRAPVTLQQLRDFLIPTARGAVPLSSLATVEQQDGPASITTIKGARAATITVTPNSDDVGTASAAVQRAVDEVRLPAGSTVSLGGVTSQQRDAFSQLGLALLVAILVVYTVMVATFRSLRQPLLLLVSIPFAATGAILLQVVSGIPLGVASLIGVLMLIGIVVTNAIVLVDLVNQYRERGMRVADALVHGASRRLRPILMTALATIFALLPLASGLTGHGSFISQPLAIVVIGGLVSSTFLTLVVLPVLYYLVEGRKERRAERRAARDDTGSPGESGGEVAEATR